VYACSKKNSVSLVVGGGSAGAGVAPGAVPALSWCGEVSLRGKHHHHHHIHTTQTKLQTKVHLCEEGWGRGTRCEKNDPRKAQRDDKVECVEEAEQNRDGESSSVRAVYA